jgi:UDPglucose 6-dehydrogenase
MNLTVIGTGYVGLVSGTCFAEMGNQVWCVDKDQTKIAALREGRIPIYEPGLEAMVRANVEQGRLHFSTSVAEAVAEAQIHFIAVGTPQSENGSADLTHVLEVAREIGRNMTQASIILNKSTVPVGSAERVREAVAQELSKRSVKIDFEVASNPEFLKEGDAIHDFMRPDRVIIGTNSPRVVAQMTALYSPFMRNFDKMIFMDVRDAEMTKYAANAMLASRISFMNELAAICEKSGVDVENVRKGIGSDARIGYSFIYPGCGYGGSCFPKDVRALIGIAAEAGIDPYVLQAVERRNESQKRRLAEKVLQRFGADLNGKTFGIWGLAFKPGTDDMREAPSLTLIEQLVKAGAALKVYDPVAMANARGALSQSTSSSVRFSDQQYEAVEGVDALILVTEWKPFRHPDLTIMRKTMRSPVIFDGRNQYDPVLMAREGFEYYGIGRGV